MTEPATRESGTKKDLGDHLDRIWRELKEVSQQIERETRRGGKIAKLHYEMRGLRQEVTAHTLRLGQLIYRAQCQSKRRPALARIDGYDELIASIDALSAEIAAKQYRIADLGGNVGRRADAA